MRRLLAIICGLWLAAGASGCAVRPSAELLEPAAQAPRFTKKVRVLVATTRKRGTSSDPDAFTAERSSNLNFAAVTVSIPSHHQVGRIEWPDQTPPDPTRHFITTGRESLNHSGFLEQVRRSARSPGRETGNVLVFVHGYNTLYQEAVYWLAQVAHDANFTGTAILFSWPSLGKAPLYLADREASTYSRDYLEKALLDIAGLPEVKEINILAHSMGTWLAVETLRQAKLDGHGDFKGKLSDVILASPDLDVHVFRTQLDVIAPMKNPITILISGDDKALALSTALAGGVKRAGLVDVHDARVEAAARQYNLRVVDLTGVDDGTGNHHSKFSRSAAVIGSIGKSLEGKAGEQQQNGVVNAVTDVGTSLLKVPAAIVGTVTQQK